MKKPRLSFWQIWNMNFGFLGIQFGFALQNANVSRIFETLGANIDNIPILWIAAPVTGLIVQPIVGHMSDNTWNSLGRRRPYFLVGAILASIALILMPNSPFLWVAAGMLWIMDASINISMEPFRAFVGDLLPSEQRNKGFAMQSFFIGIGAVVASFLPYLMTNWFGVPNTAPSGEIPPSVTYSFYIGAVIFFAAVAWTVYKTREYSPEEMEAFSEEEEGEGTSKAEELRAREEKATHLVPQKLKISPIYIVIGAAIVWAIIQFQLEQELYILGFGLLLFGVLQFSTAFMQKKGKSENGLVTIMNDLSLMPKTMKQLAVVQFFSWFALFAIWIYSTAGITSHIYDMKLESQSVNELQQKVSLLEDRGTAAQYGDLPDVRSQLGEFEQELQAGKSEVVATMKVVKFFLDEEKELNLSESTRSRLQHIQQEYNTGADWVSFNFGIYNGFAALIAFLLPVFARYITRRGTHALALVVGAVSLFAIYFISNPNLLLLTMVGVGLAWASILAMPYAMLSGSLPADKMGTYMGIFNFFLVLPQILAATILGFMVESLFGGEPIFALILGGISWIIAAIFTFLVDDVEEKDLSNAAAA